MNIINLTKDNFSKEVLECKGKVLVDFYADWCGPCKMLAPTIEWFAASRDDIVFGKVNIDDEELLAENYEIYSIPCLVLFENGKEINRSIGLKDVDELNELLGDKNV